MATIVRHVTRDVIALDSMTPCRDAARLMADRKVGSVAVREGGKLIGLVTERDLVSRVLARGDSGSMPIGEAMRVDVPNITSGASEAECANQMRDHFTRHLLVVDEGRVVGIVSMRDVIQLMLDEKQFLIEQLQTYIDGR
jgi:CBS domain-containing protein